MKLFKKRQRTVDFTKMPNAVIPKRDFRVIGDAVDLRGEKMPQSDTVDLSNANLQSVKPASSDGMLDFLSKPSTSTSPSTNVVTQVSEISELKTKMRGVTGKIEENANEIYRLIQRIELLEKKIDRFENRGI